jgi:hypothetical protein
VSVHYHIRWTQSELLDWERFGTRAEAEQAATRLVRPDEEYTIEEYDGACPKCAEIEKRFPRKPSGS